MKYKTEEVIGKKVISPVGGAETNIPKKYTEQRPWGSFEQFNLNTPCTVKIIDVKPESQLSLQFHNHRNEFWRILKGECTVMLDNKNYIAETGDEFIIPAKTLHRVTTHNQGVQFLEISYGHFDETISSDWKINISVQLQVISKFLSEASSVRMVETAQSQRKYRILVIFICDRIPQL